MCKVTIITVNLNNASGLKKTMDSVLQQTYKDVEYIVMDGGSTDGSKDVIENHRNKLVYCVSKKDKGIYNAMNNGIAQSQGEYLLFINSGDGLIRNSILEEVQDELDGTDLIFGDVLLVESEIKKWTGHYPDTLNFQHFIDSSLPHPCTFIKRTLFETVGYFDENLKITADWKFFLDAVCRHNVSYRRINKTIAIFDHNGLSSMPENQAMIKEEKKLVLQNGYAAFVPESNELRQLRAFRNQPAVRRFVKIARIFGLLNDF